MTYTTKCSKIVADDHYFNVVAEVKGVVNMKKLHISFWLLVVISVCSLTGVLQLLNELPVSYDVLVGIRCAIYLVLLILTLLMSKVGLDL